MYKEPTGFIYLNILLAGLSRSGKSCFINRMFNKLVSLEDPENESVTKEINEYCFYSRNDQESNKNEKKIELKKGYGGIKIFDTPGIANSKVIDSFKQIKGKFDDVFIQFTSFISLSLSKII